MSIQGSLSGLEWAPGSEYESAGSFARPEHVNTKSFIDYIYTRVLASNIMRATEQRVLLLK